MIQPAGLPGSPSAGQRCAATVNASWTASSAMSMSSKTRTSTSTARPYSSRKTCPMSRSEGVPGRSREISATSPSVLPAVLEGAYLDGKGRRAGHLPRPVECGVQIGRTDDGETSEVLLPLRERPVGGEHLTVPRPDDRGGARREQPAREDP